VTLEVTDASGSAVRMFSAADRIEPMNPDELRFPPYWVRQERALASSKGIHRFVWDLHYAPPENLPRSLPISATYMNTAPNPKGPWVMPGEYTVTLSVDGKKSAQKLAVRMDPRVATPRAAIAEQFDLSIACYRGLGTIQDLILENRSLRSQISSLEPKVKEKALRDSLASLKRKLAVSEGNGPPDDLDIIYATVDDDRTVRETLNGVQTRLLYVMMLLQGADAPPTDAQRSAAQKGDTVVKTIGEQWTAFKGSAVANVNRMLKSSGLEELKAGGIR
jgi:hypothetical protein